MSHIIAFILGIAVATVGLTRVAVIADEGVGRVQTVIKEAAK